MFKTLKDARRRVVQSVLSNVGASDMTQDEAYSQLISNFEEYGKDMRKWQSFMKTINSTNASYFPNLSTGMDMLVHLNRRRTKVDENGELIMTTGEPDTTSPFSFLNDLSTVMLQHYETSIIKPIGDWMADHYHPNLEKHEKRKLAVVDYDSYRRRLKSLREKHESLQNSKKSSESVKPAIAENLAEIGKFETKERSALQRVNDLTSEITTNIGIAISAYNEMAREMIIGIMVTQREAYSVVIGDLDIMLGEFGGDRITKYKDSFYSQYKELRMEKEPCAILNLPVFADSLTLPDSLGKVPDPSSSQSQAPYTAPIDTSPSSSSSFNGVDVSTRPLPPVTPPSVPSDNGFGNDHEPDSNPFATTVAEAAYSNPFAADEPDNNLPIAEIVDTPDVPVSAAPDSPVVFLFAPPSASLPEAPSAPAPEASVSVSEAPSVSVPEAPSVSVPEAPSVSVSEAPSVSVPDTPSVSVPDAPSVPVPEAPSEVPPQASQVLSQVMFVVEGVYDHPRENPDELQFNLGERVEVLSTDDENWWLGRTADGSTGLFASNYVRRLE